MAMKKENYLARQMLLNALYEQVKAQTEASNQPQQL